MSNPADLKLNELGKYQANIKITSVEPTQSGKAGFLGIEGQNKKLKYITSRSDKFAKKLEVGAEGPAEIEVVEDEYNGQKNIVAFIRSFGGATQGGYQGGGKGYSGGGRAYTPKTDAEIHSPSIAGLVKSCLEFYPETFEVMFDKALTAYRKGIAAVSGKAEEVPASPQHQAEEIDPNADKKAEAKAYWDAVGGTPDELKELQRACADGVKSYEVILKGKESEAGPAAIIRMAGGLPNAGKAEPGDHRNSLNSSGKSSAVEETPDRDWYAEFRLIADSRNWPGFADAKATWEFLAKQVLGRRVESPERLTSHDYYLLTQWAIRVVQGEEDEPAGFKARAKEAIHAN